MLDLDDWIEATGRPRRDRYGSTDKAPGELQAQPQWLKRCLE
jgi:hypothetical protein